MVSSMGNTTQTKNITSLQTLVPLGDIDFSCFSCFSWIEYTLLMDQWGAGWRGYLLLKPNECLIEAYSSKDLDHQQREHLPPGAAVPGV